MSTDKGGSDLDVFNDLKPQTPDGTPIIETKRTLMGLQAPEGGLPPVPGSSPSSSRSIPPPPPSQRPRRSGATGLSNPMASAAAEAEPGVPRDEDDRAEDTSPGIPPETAAAVAPGSPRGNGLGLDAWAMTQPSGTSGRLSLLPNPQISTLPDTLASAAAPAAAGANGDVGWDDDDDKTQVYDKDTQAAAQSLL